VHARPGSSNRDRFRADEFVRVSADPGEWPTLSRSGAETPCRLFLSRFGETRRATVSSVNRTCLSENERSPCLMAMLTSM
jgi:hypothetical protein